MHKKKYFPYIEIFCLMIRKNKQNKNLGLDNGICSLPTLEICMYCFICSKIYLEII